MQFQSYKGDILKQPTLIKRDGKEEQTLAPYFPDPELAKAVNLAQLLKRPLLVMGEPGCGKSLLASAVAFDWYQGDMLDKKKFFEWNIKSTSRAKEGLYEFDHLRRLRDANLKLKKVDKLDQYISNGPLADAMENSSNTEKAVLLIDEIDKADIDFSNDLLNELEKNTFYIPELQAWKNYPQKPFIVITSNSEKDLSDAFLRRCVFHYIDLFSEGKIASEETKRWLERIIKARFFKTGEENSELINKAIGTFVQLRQQMNTDSLTYRKTISTSEFLDWFSILKICVADKAMAAANNLDSELNAWLNDTSNKAPIPFGSTLFKTTKTLLDFSAAKK